MAIQKITADVISSDAITTASISDSAITAAKLAGTLDLTGKTITVATASSGDNDTSVASTAFVQQEIASLVDSAPGTLNTLNELAAALGDDANFSTTVTNSIATKLPLAGGTLTGNLNIGANLTVEPTAATGLSYAADGTNSYINFEANSVAASVQLYAGQSSGGFFSIGTKNSGGTLAEKMRIDPSGNVGIGTTSPSKLLHVNGQAQFENNIVLNENTPALVIPNGDFRIFTGGSETLRISSGRNLKFIAQTTNFESPGFTYHTNSYLYLRGGSSGLILSDDSGVNTIQIIDGSSGYINFETSNGSSKMRINSSGQVLIGDTQSHVDDLLQIETPASGGGHGIQIRRNDSNSDQGIGRIMFGNNTDTDLASIYVKTDGSTDNAAMTFNTQPNGGALTERMRVTSGGDISVGSNHGGFSGWRVMNLRGQSTGALYNFEASDGTRRAAIANSGTDLRLQTFTGGNITFEPGTGSEKMRVFSNGRVKIGTSFSGCNAGLHVANADIRCTGAAIANDANSISMSQESSGGVITARGPSTSQRGTITLSVNRSNGGGAIAGLKIEDDGGLFAFGIGYASASSDVNYNASTGEIFVVSSSRRYKSNITDLNIDTSKILSLRPVSYTDNETETNAVGLIAEEVHEEIPQLVNYKEIEGYDEIQPDSVKYSTLSVYLLKVIKEQQTIIDDLKSRIETLEG